MTLEELKKYVCDKGRLYPKNWSDYLEILKDEEVDLVLVTAPSAIFAVATAFAASISVSTIPFGKPPTDIPVIVPSPLITIVIILPPIR